MSQKPVFLLGFGAMKSGTTWLYRYLADHQLVSFGPSKEIHAWTMFFDPARSRRSIGISRALQAYTQAPPETVAAARNDLLRELRLSALGLDPNIYLRTFVKLARDCSRPVADITPDYARLLPRQVSTVHSFLSPHFNLKALFLMRDPVDRLFSQCKHIARGGHRSSRHSRGASEALSLFRASLDGGESLPGGLKSDYKHAVDMLDAVFGAQDVLYLFYEDLFSLDSVRRITDFLGVPFVEPDFQVRHNADPDGVGLEPELVSEAVRALLPVYQFAEKRFNGLPCRWRENLDLLHC